MNNNHFVDTSPPGIRFPKELLLMFGAIVLFVLGMFAERELNKRNTDSEVARLTSNNLKLVAVNKQLDSDRNKTQQQLTQKQTQIKNFRTCLEQSGVLNEQ